MSLFSKKPEPESIRVGGDSRVLNERHERQERKERVYGIAEAILLMRSVPVEQNVELVVHVIRNTLESMNVHLADIIGDASAKEKSLQQRIETLGKEIAEFEKQIDIRGQEIARLQNELSETTAVKDRLVMAQKLSEPPAAPVMAQKLGEPPAPVMAAPKLGEPPTAPPAPKRDGSIPPVPPPMRLQSPAPGVQEETK